MAALETVQDYVQETRVLLQDLVPPYRYSDGELVQGLNFAFFEIARIRPDILVDGKYLRQVNRSYKANRLTVPTFSVASMGDTVDLPYHIRIPVVYYMTGHAQLRDVEDTQDQRAILFASRFVQQLQTVAS